MVLYAKNEETKRLGIEVIICILVQNVNTEFLLQRVQFFEIQENR
jgi:hypothetical protein